MLLYTSEQQRAVLANRRNWNASQVALAASIGSDAMVGNAAPLPKDVWGAWDREGVEIQRDLQPVFNDLAATLSMPMAIGKLVHHFQTISDSGNVNVSLDGRSKARTDQPVYAYHGTPIPIIDSSFSYGWRQVEAARTEGFNLDAAGRANSQRKIAEKAESAVLNGYAGIEVNGEQSYGLRTHPKRSTRTTAQALITATGAEWVANVVATLKLLHAKNFKVPATLYVNFDDWFYANSTDFKANGDKTIAQRVLEIANLGQVIPADSIAAGEIIAVVKRREVVQVLNSMPMTTRAQFRANPEDDYNFSVMMAAAVEIKFDAEDNCGVAHSTLA
jgi:uncharacterized linocin/CFP29 family protein